MGMGDIMIVEKVTEEEFDYFLSKIDWGKTFLDAKALDIMNRLGTLFKKGSCEGCGDFIEGVCKDTKGHYCIRSVNMEDRYFKVTL